ncbi:EI24 domain-containing protein [Microbacterium sp. 179-B 1A2 NHS]|uniref:EI24 domain-containing protein n=1 Tax=Microbacterium sp. 179-B 1A2 NHS TaxID=3142383 RepID=UPI0039A042F1
MREFLRGMATLGRGFGYWPRRPRQMALGLVPAGIVGIVLLAALITLGAFLPSITDAVTPFANDWREPWATVIRFAVGTAVFGGAIVLAAVSFTALTLIVGEPFYDRIWRAVETDLGGTPPEAAYGFWRSVLDGIGLLLRGLLAALVAGLIGLVPAVGGVLGAAAAVFLSGRLLADELTSRALSARGIPADRRRALTRPHRARVLGFGVATQLCFMVPLGAVITMPAAIAASTLLARHLLAEAEADAGARA